MLRIKSHNIRFLHIICPYLLPKIHKNSHILITPGRARRARAASVIRQSYGAHSIGFWQKVSNKTKYWQKPLFLPLIFAHKGFTLQQRISQNLWQNVKNRIFTGYDWYFLGTLKISEKLYFVPNWKYCKFLKFWAP